MASLEAAYQAVAQERSPAQRRTLADTARERRTEAERWRWYLMVQRERLGIHDPGPADEVIQLLRPPAPE